MLRTHLHSVTNLNRKAPPTDQKLFHKKINHDHIRSFPGRESHYGREDSNKLYLSSERNIKLMHEPYLKKYEDNNYQLFQQGQQIKTLVSYHFYFRQFKESFNIRFGSYRTDTCKKCDVLKNKVRNALQVDEKK